MTEDDLKAHYEVFKAEILQELTNLLHQHQRSRRHNFYINGLLDAMNTIEKMNRDSDGQL